MRLRTIILAAVAAPLVMFTMPVIALMARSGPGAITTTTTVTSVPGIPAILLQAYEQAATRIGSINPGCTGMRWQILAAIGMAESSQAAGHQITADGEITPPIYGVTLNGSGTGGNTTPVYSGGSYARALGPMQILPTTWAQYAHWGRPRTGTPDPQNVFDATLTAAAVLCGGGHRNLADPTELATAILSYNNSSSYLSEVESWITKYDTIAASASTESLPAGVAEKVISYTEAQLGKPYQWGGTGPDSFDCSGLAMMAYRAAGISIPRTSQQQWTFGKQIPASQVQPGDLVFFAGSDGTPSSPGHVGIVIDPASHEMIDAYATGYDVEYDTYGIPGSRSGLSPVVGFTRPP